MSACKLKYRWQLWMMWKWQLLNYFNRERFHSMEGNFSNSWTEAKKMEAKKQIEVDDLPDHIAWYRVGYCDILLQLRYWLWRSLRSKALGSVERMALIFSIRRNVCCFRNRYQETPDGPGVINPGWMSWLYTWNLILKRHVAWMLAHDIMPAFNVYTSSNFRHCLVVFYSAVPLFKNYVNIVKGLRLL